MPPNTLEGEPELNKKAISSDGFSIIISIILIKNSPFRGPGGLKLRVLREPWERDHIADVTHTGYKQYQTLEA